MASSSSQQGAAGRKKKSSDWTQERELTLIRFYKENPVLFETKGIKSSKSEKNALKLVLVEGLDKKFSESEISTRFNHMRATFVANEKKVAEAAKKGMSLVPTWHLFEKLKFLGQNPGEVQEVQDAYHEVDEGAQEANHEVVEEVPEVDNEEEVEVVDHIDLVSAEAGNEDVIADSVILDEVVIEELNWTVEMEVQLIDFFKSNPVLWNHKLDGYKKAGKCGILDELSQSFDQQFTNKYLMDKFQCFKLRFLRNLKKVQQSSKSGAGTSEIYEPTWTHYERLQFLKEANQTDPATSFMDVQDDVYMQFFERKEPESPLNSPLVPAPKQSAKKRKLEEERIQEQELSLSKDVMTAALSFIQAKSTQPQAHAPAPASQPDEYEAFSVIVLQKLRKISASDADLLMNDIWMDMMKYKPTPT